MASDLILENSYILSLYSIFPHITMIMATSLEKQTSNNTCSISVVVCTRNRRQSLLETLDSLEAQRLRASPDRSWEVLVVDNGSDDGTVDAVLQRESKFPATLRVVVEPTTGLSHGRNRALREANGRAVIFIDDDVTCHEGWLAAHAAAFEDPKIVGTAGPILPSMPSETPDWFHEVLQDEIGGPTSRYYFGDEAADIVGDGGIALPFGANMGVLRHIALEVGGFRTDLGWGKKMIPSEELEFFRRVQARVGRIRYAPEASLTHHIEPRRVTMEYYRSWQQGFGRSLVVMDPPGGSLARVRSVVISSRRLLRWIVRRWQAKDTRSQILTLREAERERGRLKELCGR
jgi:glycosyltransferase involved in cell wall biosynthesis